MRERWRLAGPRWRAALIAVLLALVLLTMSAEIGIVSDSTRRILFALWAVTNLVVAFGVERQVDRTKNIPPPGRRA